MNPQDKISEALARLIEKSPEAWNYLRDQMIAVSYFFTVISGVGIVLSILSAFYLRKYARKEKLDFDDFSITLSAFVIFLLLLFSSMGLMLSLSSLLAPDLAVIRSLI